LFSNVSPFTYTRTRFFFLGGARVSKANTQSTPKNLLIAGRIKYAHPLLTMGPLGPERIERFIEDQYFVAAKILSPPTFCHRQYFVAANILSVFRIREDHLLLMIVFCVHIS
jgi:hypothetical protein